MAWRVAGSYLASCSCELDHHWVLGANPDVEPEGGCRGVAVFHIGEASGEPAILAGTLFAVINVFPEQLTYGWRVGVVVPDEATDEQARAAEALVTGEIGGPFLTLAKQAEGFADTERAAISVEPGEEPLVRVGSHSVFKFSRRRGPDGDLIITPTGMYPFVSSVNPGSTAGTPAKAMDITWLPSHGEHGTFDVTSE